MKVFGFNITKSSKGAILPKAAAIRKEANDGAFELKQHNGFAQGESNYAGISFNAEYASTIDLINFYRTMSIDAHVSDALEDIVNEAIVNDVGSDVLAVNLDNTALSEDIKNKISIAFDRTVNLLNFNSESQELFKKWYIDGRLYAYKVLNDNKSNNNKDITQKNTDSISEVRILDPRHVKFIREIDQATDKKLEYFIYNDEKDTSAEPLIISRDAMVFVPSGDYDIEGNIISPLHTAIKPYNQLIALEDYTVIHRITRSTERRVFYIDVGELPKTKAEQYMQSIINKHKNKVTYDSVTGKMSENNNVRSMLEDVWLPRRNGERSTEVDTLQGSSNLGDMEDVAYFKRKLFQAMHIPASRLDVSSTFMLGRGAEITRDELKFNRYIEKLRRRFNKLVLDVLSTEVVLNNILSLAEWNDEKENIQIDYNEDAHFAELKDAELMDLRLTALSNVEEYIGKYFSVEQIHKDFLHRSEKQIEATMQQIKDEKAAGIIPADDEF